MEIRSLDGELLASVTALAGMTINEGRLNYAALAEADMTGCKLPMCDLAFSDLSGANIDRALLHATSFLYVNAPLSIWDYSEALGAEFGNANLRGASFVKSNLSNCDFGGADLRDCDFRGARCYCTDFRGARLQGAKFDSADLVHARFAN